MKIKKQYINYKNCLRKFDTLYEQIMFGLKCIKPGHSYPKAWKIILEDFQNIQNFNVIQQTVYRNDVFEKFFHVIKEKQKQHLNFSFNSKQLKQYFPKSWLITRYLRKNNWHKHLLYISILDFKNEDELINALNFWLYEKIDKNNQTFKDLFQTLQDSDATFRQFQTDKYSIIFLKKNKFTIDDVRHQFGHYIDWLKNVSQRNVTYQIQPENKFQKDAIEYFDKIFKIDGQLKFYFLQGSQFQQLLNDFLQQLKILKNKHFQNLSNYQFAKMISNDLIIDDKHNSLREYLDSIQTLLYFQQMKKFISFASIIFYNVIGMKTTTIKNHIFGYFSESFKKENKK